MLRRGGLGIAYRRLEFDILVNSDLRRRVDLDHDVGVAAGGVLFVSYGVVAYVVKRDVAPDTSSLSIFIWAAAGSGLCASGCRVPKEIRR